MSGQAGAGVTYVGRTARSARSWSRRAISGSPASTSFVASRNTSCCADRISRSMISMTISFRCSSPAMRYQTDGARSLGDLLADETGEYEVIGRPYTTNAGKDAHVRVKRVDNAEVTMIRTWSAHERVAVTRAAAEEGKR